jgi:peptidoglycan/LPS O-acetylase OafA/YrhL
MVLFFATLGLWYYVVSVSPGSVSEYLPREEPADITTIGPAFLFAVIWLAPFYLTWKRRRVGLLGGAVFGLVNLVAVLVAFITKFLPAPDFSDFLYFPMLVFGIVASAMAWRASKSS